MMTIKSVMETFCRAGAEAVSRYVEVAGMGPNPMPEYFMPAIIFDRIGTTITATLETSFSTLVEWNKTARDRLGISPNEPHNDRLLRLAERVEGRRIDMVLYEGQEQGKAKDEQGFFALVEFKRSYIDAILTPVPGRVTDRDKLLMLLEHIDTCPWGVVCGWFYSDHRDWQKREGMKGTKDLWFDCEINLPAQYKAPVFFGARVFERSPDQTRLQELSELTSESAAGG